MADKRVVKRIGWTVVVTEGERTSVYEFSDVYNAMLFARMVK